MSFILSTNELTARKSVRLVILRREGIKLRLFSKVNNGCQLYLRWVIPTGNSTLSMAAVDRLLQTAMFSLLCSLKLNLLKTIEVELQPLGLCYFSFSLILFRFFFFWEPYVFYFYFCLKKTF